MTVEAEVLDVERKEEALARRHPGVPTSINELAALKGEAVEIIEARAQVLATLRTAAIRATSPEDWLLFKAPDEQGAQVVGYLQDCGCDRVRDLYGIEVFNVSSPQKESGAEPGIFHYLISGDGRCKITRQTVEAIEGGRSSTDDFCRGKTGIELELLVRKAARANMDGNITRELAGMKSVPVAELQAAWTGTSKKIENCRRGRGFGTASERLGANREADPDVEPPTCPHCQPVNGMPVKLKYRHAKGDRQAFYGCPNYEKHPQQKVIVNAAEWIAKQKPAAPAKAEPEPAKAAAPSTRRESKSSAPTAGDIFGSGREPGQEG